MVNTFNSANELWTEIALSGGWIEVLAGADCLSAKDQDTLNAIKAFGVANSYIRKSHSLFVVECMKKVICEMTPGTTD